MALPLLRRVVSILAALWIGVAAVSASAKPVPPSERKERQEPLPKRLDGIDVVEHLDTELPKHVEFYDEHGRRVKLGDYFDGKLPVIVTLNYSGCPMLCSLILNGLVDGLKQVKWTAGKDFRILTVSIDPAETPEISLRTKQRYVESYGRPEAREGWHFLTGSPANVRAIADVIGFKYGYNEKRKEYVHPAAITLVTPSGRIARYLYGIEFLERTLSWSLVEASEGKIGTTVDRLLLYCFHYDSSEGRYAPVAINVMRLGGSLTAVLLGGLLTVLWRAELRKKRKLTASGVPDTSAPATLDRPPGLGSRHERPAT
jgi:protein SCO1/2